MPVRSCRFVSASPPALFVVGDLRQAAVAEMASLAARLGVRDDRSRRHVLKSNKSILRIEARDQPLSLPLIVSEPFGHGDDLGEQRYLQHKENNLGRESNDERQ